MDGPVKDGPLIAMFLGDRYGIGPEIVVGHLAAGDFPVSARFTVLGDLRMLERGARSAGVKLPRPATDGASSTNPPTPSSSAASPRHRAARCSPPSTGSATLGQSVTLLAGSPVPIASSGHGTCEELAADEGLRAVVLRGTGGKAFIAGTDIGQFRDLRHRRRGLRRSGGDRPPNGAIARIDR